MEYGRNNSRSIQKENCPVSYQPNIQRKMVFQGIEFEM